MSFKQPSSTGSGVRILVVEDDPDITALIAYQLTREGLRVETAASGSEALESISRDVPNLIVLDRMLPEISGDDVLKRLRSEPRTAAIPVLVLTAKREQQERIEGLELGADDYLTKPFSPQELVLRVQAILRRSEAFGVKAGGRVLRAGPIRMDVESHQVSVEGEEVNLTPTEFRLLQVLMDRRGRTQSRHQLLEEAWDVESRIADQIHTRTVDMHVRRLRGKLGPVGDWIETMRGFGYRLKIPGGAE